MIRRVVLAAVTVVLAVLGLGVLGTFLPEVPALGLATGFVPPVMSWVVLSALACGLVALAIRWRHRSRYASVLVAVALTIAVGGTVVTARMVSAVENAGAHISIADTLRVLFRDVKPPDEERTYTTFEGEPLKVSVYRAVARGSKAPVLVYLHGGGWVAGDRDANSADMRWFADHGWLTITVDYSLSSADRHLWDVVQNQIGCALAWVAANAASYGGDPARLSLSGDSAGGNLAINTAYLRATGQLQSSCGGAVPAVAAVTTLYPAVDPADLYANADVVLGSTSRGMAAAYTGGTPTEHPDRYAAIASVNHLSSAAPPTMILIGTDDHLVPVGATHRFVDTARGRGIGVELISVPYADHVFNARPGSIGQQAYRQLTTQWLRDHGQGPS